MRGAKCARGMAKQTGNCKESISFVRTPMHLPPSCLFIGMPPMTQWMITPAAKEAQVP